MFLKLNAYAFYTYLVFFGFWCVLTGYLIFKSAFMPRIIGVLEAFAGLCWLTFLWPPLAHYLSPYNQALAGLAELTPMLWLLVMGVNAERWKEQASAAWEWRSWRACPARHPRLSLHTRRGGKHGGHVPQTLDTTNAQTEDEQKEKAYGV